MTTDFDIEALRDRLAASQQPAWQTASDLSKLSIAAFQEKDSPVRRARSSGLFRLDGEGAQGSRASAKDFASVITNFQRVLNAIAAAFDGHKSWRGKLPDAAVALSRLDIVAEPLSGSVVVRFEPHVLPEHEISNDGTVALIGQAEAQTADRAVHELLDLFETIHSADDASAGNAFIARVEDLGPRVATTVRDLADSLADGLFVPDIRWVQPRGDARRTRLSSAELAYISRLVSMREADREPVVLEGVLRTVSDVEDLRLQVDGSAFVDVAAGDIPPETIRGLHVDGRVRIEADVRGKSLPGGAEVLVYTAKRIELLD
jgi:hypothetical protein